MTALLVLVVWFGLSCLTAALVTAVLRGARYVELDATAPREDVDLPGPRAGSDSLVRPTARR